MKAFFLTLVLALVWSSGAGQIFNIDSLPANGILLDKGWKFHAGDNRDWAKPDFDDSKWEGIDPTLVIPQLSQVNTQKPLWLRLKFTKKISEKVALAISQSGASQLFLNGKLIHSFGLIAIGKTKTIAYDPSGNYLILPLDSVENTLAVRYCFQENIDYRSIFDIRYPLFSGHIYPTNYLLSQNTQATSYFWDGFNVGVFIILFIVHFIFFIAYPPAKANFWYCLWALFGTLFSYLLYSQAISHSIDYRNFCTQYAITLGNFQNIFIFYSVYLLLKEKNFWLVIIFSGLMLFSYVNKHISISPIYLFAQTLVYISLVFYMGLKAKNRGIPGGIYVVFGMLSYIIFWGLFVFNFSWGLLDSHILFHLASLSLPITVSALLGLDFRNTNLSLIRNLEDVNRLSTEKQQILAAQNETLERQVNERTAELKASQAQLIQKEKLASLGELTAGIAHEIQNPLNFVNNFSEVSTELVSELEEEQQKPERDTDLEAELLGDLKQNLQKITHHGGRASAIVKGMLEHSRSSTGERQPIDLNALADEYLRLAYQGLRAKDKDGSTGRFNAELVTEFDPALPNVPVVSQDIGRVLLNLYNNAFYAVHQQQKTAPTDYQPTVSVGTRRTETGVEIRVQDNGTGIPDTVKARVFQPFFTTKPTGEGTGLGLSLAYDIVTKGHGGTLAVESAENEGTTFILTLPA